MRIIKALLFLIFVFLYFSCSNSLHPITELNEDNLLDEKTQEIVLTYDNERDIVLFIDENNKAIDIQSHDEDQDLMIKCVDAIDFRLLSNEDDMSRSGGSSLFPKAVVIGMRSDKKPGIWLVYNDGTVHSPVNEKTGRRSSMLHRSDNNGEDIVDGEYEGFLGWTYYPTLISDDGLLIAGYTLNEKGFRSRFLNIEPGAQAAVYWTLKKNIKGYFVISKAKVIGTLPYDSDTSKGRFYGWWRRLISKLKLLFLDYLDDYLVEPASLSFDMDISLYSIFGLNKDGNTAVALLDPRNVYSITVKEEENKPPVASFYDYDYLVEGAGIPGVNGEYTLLPYEIDSTAAYSNGSHYIFRFRFGPRYWSIDSETSGQSSIGDMLYYKLYSSVSDYLPETKPGDSSTDYSIGDGMLPVPQITGRTPISGYTGEEGYILRGNYIFTDAEGDLEENTTYKWYRSDDSSVAGLEIPGATEQAYETGIADEGQFLRFEVTPADSAGSIGVPLLSEPVFIFN